MLRNLASKGTHMLGNFTYHNPTKLIFGQDAMDALANELAGYGSTVQLIYGGGSIKRNGIYDQVVAALARAGKTVVEDAGVMPNPTVEKLLEGVRIARENNVDFLLAVGGGSCIDYAKAVAVSANLPEGVDPCRSTGWPLTSRRPTSTFCPWARSSRWWAPAPR